MFENINKTFTVHYITGIPDRDKPTKNYRLIYSDTGITLKYVFTEDYFISWESIRQISAETHGQVTKSLSMGKAAIGLVIAGPLGALIGAGIGSKHDNRQSFILINYDIGQGEYGLVLESKEAQSITNKLKTLKYRNQQTL